MRILGLHHDLLSLMGPTRLFLEMMDLFAYLGHDVWIVGRTKRATVWKEGGIVSEKLVSKQYDLHNMKKYHPLKYLDHVKDITLAELPLVYLRNVDSAKDHYNYMPSALIDAIPKVDMVFADTELYLPLGKFIPGNYLFYIHWPLQRFKNYKPLMPEAPAKIWCNSHYTAQEITRLWDPEWDSSWPPLNPKVVYPPLWTDMYDGSLGFEGRIFDVVMFSRLYEDKIRFLDDLKKYKLAIVGSDYGLKDIPKWVKLWKGVPLKTVIHVLGHSKVYVHCKGFGQLKSGAPSEKEHFGQTLVEAMCCGCVPIVPEGGGPIEIIGADGEYGYTFSSVQELKGKVDMLLRDEDLWAVMSRKALDRAKDFDITKVAEKVEQLLRI